MTALPETGVDYYEFDPDRCAEMHNRIVSIIVTGPLNRDSTYTVANFMTANESIEQTDPFKEFLSAPLLHFLSKINVITTTSPGRSLSFTPHLEHPHPLNFFTYQENDIEDKYPYAIMLYAASSGESDDGGLFFDMATNLVTRIAVLSDWPKEDEWVTLEEALERYLEMFETGKYHVSEYDPNASGSTTETNAEADIVQAVDQYNALLSAIAARTEGAIIYDKPLVDPEILRKWGIKGFAFEFLSRARSPSFSYIAPGITVFNDRTLDEMMARDVGSPRQQTSKERYSGESHLAPMLLFPGDTPIVEEDPFLKYESVFFFDNLAGVYLWGSYNFGDELKFILPYPIGKYVEGEDPTHWKHRANSLLYQHGSCPFFPGHHTRLATLLQLWTFNVEQGQFDVGPDGVKGGMDFYRQAESAQTEIQFFLDKEACWYRPERQ